MVTLTLLEKIYGLEEDRSFRSLQKHLSSFSSGLEAKIKVLGKTEQNWIQVEVSGSDSVVATNYLNQKFGLAPSSLEELKVQSELQGKIVDSGKIGYGLYVDVGVSASKKRDVLVSLYVLRKQLFEDEKLSIHMIIEAFCLHDNFPLRIKMTRIAIDKSKMEAELSEAQLTAFKNWVSLGLDRVIVLGASPDQIEYAIKKSGSMRDVIRVDRLGFFECSIICKLGTEAPGIISRLGNLLEGVPLYAFSPKKIKSFLKK